ncbi:MAG: NAD(P)-dependent glycerol-3-phosphate dehydrogenase [Candidatus Aminicenantes bacterium]|nr:NAD(P)-dependent glycerol-3-phosphate dehydrogenase [Candidatus Aminicenantes bacterium]
MKASVIGGGSWGSAFALHLGKLDIKTRLWIREKDVYEETLQFKENRTFLPGFVFSPTVTFFHNMEEAVASSDVVFIAVPSKFCRQIYEKLAAHLSSNHQIVSLTKGIEEGSLKRMSEVMEEVFSPFFTPHIAVLSGPSFAKEVVENHPTAVVLASKEEDLAKKAQHLISSPTFRTYTSGDIAGVELAGSIKNVIAIAAGISDAFQFGSNSVAALVTRGIAEMTRLGLKLGAKMETFAGLAGIGDLVLTCTGKLSRNRYIGLELGRGKNLPEIVSAMKMVAEGVTTTLSVHQLVEREKVEMPICEQIYQVLYKNKDPRTALQNLMARKLKSEYTAQQEEINET